MANQAIAYIEGLRLGCNAWQAYETWEANQSHYAVLAQWDSGFEVQNIIEVPTAGGPVRWTPCRIFRGDRAADFRGACVWFNPDEIERDVMVEHNRRVASSRRRPAPMPNAAADNIEEGLWEAFKAETAGEVG
jgi:hypothetical protein